MPKIARLCPVCGSTFSDWPSNVRVTCSYHCARLPARPDGRAAYICAHCGTAFTVWASHKAVYCSRACFLAAHGSVDDRFWSHVPNRPAEGCWLWNGVRRDWYATFKSGGQQFSAHRFSYELHHGPVPDGHVVRHTCDCSTCVRPDHLITGTTAENVHDREERGRHPHPGPRKLSDADVGTVRTMLRQGATGNAIARRFGVSQGLISLIKHNKHRS